MLRRYPGTDFVTGLRAYAALFVVMIHSGGFSNLGPLGANFTNAGKYGVQMFFVIAGFSIAASYLKAQSYGPYIIQRLARIWPLYAVVVAVYAAATAHGVIQPSQWLKQFGVELDAYNILMHLSFLSFLDYRIANSIIGVEWSIPIEVFWYLLLPLFLSRWYSYRALFVAILALIALRAAQRIPLDAYLGRDANLASTWMPLRHGAHFVFGVVAYKVRQGIPHLHGRWNDALATGAVMAILAIMLSGMHGPASDLVAVATAVLIAFYRDTAGLPRVLLTNRVALFLGTISYSLYLLHMLAIGLCLRWTGTSAVMGTPAGFAVVAAVTVALSTLTYVLIERPTNRLGRRLSAWLSGQLTERMGGDGDVRRAT